VFIRVHLWPIVSSSFGFEQGVSMKIDAALMPVRIEKAGEAAKKFEEQGFDGVLSFEGPHDPFFPLVLAAQATERVELTTAIAIAFARNPMICAQMANDLQLISGGRFILGLGTQIRTHIERRFSQTWSKPNARMREFVRAIRAIWRCWETGEKLDFRGEFYQHTLMTPVFNPGPNPHGTPRIYLAGFGPKMVGIAGEVADGWILHPLHSPDFIDKVTMPALCDGARKADRDPAEIDISAQVITMLGSTDEQVAKARNGARAQVAFYSSTPAYKVMLDHHGWGDIQPDLNKLSKQGKWVEMIEFISDEMLDTLGVSGTPAEVAKKLRDRNGFADRTSLIAYNETGEPDAVAEVVRLLNG
jgi:probable F420-dependent oxidoreductase